jgi:predicted ester cyclase
VPDAGPFGNAVSGASEVTLQSDRRPFGPRVVADGIDVQWEKPMNDLVARVEQARQCWNAGDLPGYLTLYDASVRVHGSAPAPFDKTAATAFYDMIWSSLGAPGKPNPQLDFYETVADEKFYSCRFTMSGCHRGAFLGAQATGKPYVLSGITIMRFTEDRKTVVERWSLADMLGLLTQIGAVPAPPIQ